MRILHCTELFWKGTGGLGVFVHNLATAQNAGGDAVMVLFNSPNDSGLPPGETRDGVELRRAPFSRALQSRVPAQLAQVVRETQALKAEFQPDVIHVHTDGFIPWLHLLTPFPGVPTVVTLHTPRAHVLLPDPILERLLHSADKVVAVSAATRAEWCARHEGLEARSTVILNGIPPFTTPIKPPPLNPVTLLCLGRLDPAKGFDVALSAFALLATENPSLRLTIAGDGPARPELEQLAGELGLASRVAFPGWIAPDRIADTLNNSTLMLMPSRWPEPFGLVAIEAAWMERPLIASRVGGIPEIVLPGETGLLVPPDDAPALAAAVRSLLDRPEEIIRLGRTARDRTRRHFSLERCAGDYRQLYHSLAGVATNSS